MATLIGLKLTCVKPKDFYFYVKSTLSTDKFVLKTPIPK